MKANKIYKLIEGSFLISIIVIIYIMSIFTAKGQMTWESSLPLELQLRYNNKESFIQERIMHLNYAHRNEFAKIVPSTETHKHFEGINKNQSNNQKKYIPKATRRKRNSINKLQAPILVFPLN